MKIIDLKETMYSDQTGKFPYLSSRGNCYIMVAYHTDANYNFMEPMKNCTEAQMLKAYQAIFERMKEAGLGVRKHILDNEISAEYRRSSKRMAPNMNWSLPENTDATSPNVQSKHAKTILLES